MRPGGCIKAGLRSFDVFARPIQVNVTMPFRPILSGSYQTIGRIREALEKRGIVFTEHGVEQRRPSGKEAPTREE